MKACRVTRRGFVSGAVGAAAIAAMPPMMRAALASQKAPMPFTLTAVPAEIPLVGGRHPKTKVWSFGATVPGPEIRVRQGDRIRVTVDNKLAEETTVHWHGIRLPNAMDGVPDITQPPIKPGGRFVYEFDAVDAGTFWYHSHANSVEQLARGLYGPLIVEEPTPPEVDRDVTWVIDDWRLDRTAQIESGFDNFHDRSHAGRYGNSVTVNGRIVETVPVRSGERIRLRLINAANARIFRLRFEAHTPWLVALDGHPLEPRTLADGRLVLGPGMRADLIMDMSGKPGSRVRVIDDYRPRQAYRVLDLAYGKDTPVRPEPPAPPTRLADNPVPAPDLAKARRHRIVFGGGAMGGMMARRMDRGRMGRDRMGQGRRAPGMMGGLMPGRDMMRNGMFWTINGTVYRMDATSRRVPTLLTLKKGETNVLEMHNVTAFDHPMHLHGHTFRVLARNGTPLKDRVLQDTVMMAPNERVEIAFVADNPGDWLFHCHIAEHMASGMMALVKVT